jgi:hypothetical protein
VREVGGGRGHRDFFEAGDDGGSLAIVVGVVVVDGQPVMEGSEGGGVVLVRVRSDG